MSLVCAVKEISRKLFDFKLNFGLFSMAGTEFSDEPVFKLKLLVDKEKNKVVLAEVCKDFVDVLFSFLILPMGTIVRFLQKYQQNQNSQPATIGCFNNLYKSVVDMSTEDFLTEPCRHILLNPINAKERECKRLKVNIDDTPVAKYYRCPNWKLLIHALGHIVTSAP